MDVTIAGRAGDQHLNKSLHEDVLNKDDQRLNKRLHETDVQHLNKRLYEAVLNRDLTLIRKLVDEGIDLDCKEERGGCTVLHRAAQFNLYDVIAYLVFLGADPQIKNKKGEAVSDICRDSTTKTLLNGATKLAVQNEFRHIVEDCNELSERKRGKCKFSQCNVTLRCRKVSAESVIIIRCRRVRFEENSVDFGLTAEEHICSDVFIFCTDTTEVCKNVKFKIPVCCKLQRNEELVIKTNTKQTICVSKDKKKQKWRHCSFRNTVPSFLSLLAVCRPKTEIFTVDVTQESCTSSIEPKLTLELKSNIVKTPTNIQIQVKDLQDSLTRERRILSSTPFFVFDTVLLGTTAHVAFTFPLPAGYTGLGTLTVMSFVGDSHGTDGHNWAVMPANIININDGCFHFTGSLSKVMIALEITNTQSGDESRSVAKRYASDHYRSVLLGEFSVVFFIMTKISKRHEIVITCCTQTEVDDVVALWENEDFDVQICTQVCKTFAKQPFSIKVSEQVQVCNGKKDNILQFHPKRKNFISLEVNPLPKDFSFTRDAFEIRKVYNHKGGRLEDVCVEIPLEMKKYIKKLPTAVKEPVLEIENHIVKVETVTDIISETKQLRKWPTTCLADSAVSVQRIPDSHIADGVAEQQEIKHVKDDSEERARKPIYASPTHTTVHTDTARPLTTRSIILENKAMTIDRNFFDDNYLEYLLDEIGDAWSIVLILMGVPFITIETSMVTTTNNERELQTILFKLLRQWRDDNLYREDRGVPILLSALRKGGRWDVSISVQMRLKIWHDQAFAIGDPLYTWLERAYRDPDIYIPGDYPKPMSDQFFVMLTPLVPPSPQLISALSLPFNESSNIRQNKCLVDNTLTVMKILTLFCTKTGSDVDKLETLLTTLSNLNYQDALHVAMTTIRGWLKRSTASDDAFRNDVASMMLHRFTRGVGSASLDDKSHTRRLSVDTALKIFGSGTSDDVMKTAAPSKSNGNSMSKSKTVLM